jgi:nitrite reductase/ring-hydroxylating ferredoxin subunit
LHSGESRREGGKLEGTRRTWVQVLLGTGFFGSVVSFLYPAVRFMMPPEVAGPSVEEVVAGKVGDFSPNTGKIFRFGSRPGILILTESGEWRSFTAVCTHLNCTVQFREETHQIWCACHNGTFDLNGQVVGGPPPRPLEEFNVNIREDDIVVSRRS